MDSSAAEMIEGASVQIRTAKNGSMARVVQQFASEDGYANEEQINNAYEYIKKSKAQKLKLRRALCLLSGTVVVLLIAIGIMTYWITENSKESHIQNNANGETTVMTSVKTGMPVTTGRAVYDGGNLLKVLEYEVESLSSVEAIHVPVADHDSDKPMYYSNKIEGYLIKDNVLNFFMATAGHILKISCQKEENLCLSTLTMNSVEYNVTSTDFEQKSAEAEGTVLHRLLDEGKPLDATEVPKRNLLQRKVRVMGVLVFYTGGQCYVETQASDGRTISYVTDMYWCREANLVTAQPVYTPPQEETGCYVQTRSYGNLNWYTCSQCKSWYGNWFTCRTRDQAYYGGGGR